MANVQIVISGNAAGAVGATRSVEKAFLSLGRVVKATAAIFGGIQIARALKSAGEAALAFDKGMRNVNSLSRLSEKQLASLSKQVLALAGPTAQAPQTLAEGLYDIVSSGFEANDAVKILGVSAKAATAGLTDTATATKAVAAVLNAYSLGAEDARHVSDVLFQTVNKGVLTFEELATSIGDVLPFAAQLHVPIEDVGAAMATMTLQGLSAAESSTRLKGLLVTMIKPGEDLAKTIKSLGFESGEAMLKQKGLVDTVQLLDRAANSNKETLGEWFPNIRALGGFLALSGAQMERFAAVTKSMDAASKGAGATARAFAEQSKSLSFQWDRAKASLTAAAIPLAQLLFPALMKGADLVGRFATSVTTNMPKIKQQFGEIAGFVGDAAKALFNFGKSDIGVSLGASVLAMTGLSKAAGAAKGAISGLMGLGIGGWAAAGVAVVGLLAGALTFLAQQGDLAEDAIAAVEAALNRLKGAGSDVTENTDAYTAALARRERAELGIQQALRNRELVEQSITNGEIKGKDATLARTGAELAVRDAFRERNQATKDLFASMDRLAESQRTEREEARKSQEEVGRLVNAFTRVRDVLKEAKETRAEGGFVDPRALGILEGAAPKVELFTKALRGARQAAQEIGPTMETELGRKTAAGIDKALGAIEKLVKETGRVPTSVEIETALKDNGVPKRIRGIIADMLDLDKTDANPKVDVPSAAGAKSDIEDVTAAARNLDRQKARPTVSVNDQATPVIGRVFGLLRNLNGTTATTYVRTVYRSSQLPQGTVGRAGGGFIPGADTGGRDSVQAILAPGEVVLNRAQQNVLGGPGFFAKTFGFSMAGVPGVQAFAEGGFVSRISKAIKRDKKRSGYKTKARELVSIQKRLDRNRERQDLKDREIGQLDRQFSISVEEFIKVDADGNETLDTAAVQKRVEEINQLIGKHDELLKLIDEETAILNALIEALEAAVRAYLSEIKDQERVIREMTAIVRDASKQMADAPEDQKAGYQKVIDNAERRKSNAKDKISDLRSRISDLKGEKPGVQSDKRAQPFDRRDVELAVMELGQERTDTLAIRARPAEPTSSFAESAASSAGADGFGSVSSGLSGGLSAEDQKRAAFLEAMNAELRRQLGQLRLALGIQEAQVPVIGAFQRGTLNVATTGLALVHAGERITPRGIRSGPVLGSNGAAGEVIVRLELSDELDRLVDARVLRAAPHISVQIGEESHRRFRAGDIGPLTGPTRNV